MNGMYGIRWDACGGISMPIQSLWKAETAGKPWMAQRLKSMLELIQKEYNEPLDLAQIAKAANIGERECLRCFHRTIGHFSLAVSAAVSCFSGGTFAAGNQSAGGGSRHALRF